MVSATLSNYIVCDGRQDLLKKWVCSLLLDHGLFDSLLEAKRFDRCNAQFVCGVLEILPCEFGDEAKLFGKLAGIQQSVQHSGHDEGDPFCVNTRWIQTAIGLSEGELELLRFYLIATANSGIKEALSFHNHDFHEPTLCSFLAEFLQISIDEVSGALAPDGPLKRSGLIRLPFSYGLSRHLSDWIGVEQFLVDRVFRRYDDVEQILNVIYSSAAPANLALEAFEHLAGLSVIGDYLKASIATNKTGVNILLWGEPGTGKTELARALNTFSSARGLEVACLDGDGEPLTEPERMARYRVGQYMFGRSTDSLFIFDEVESILCDVNFSLHGIQGKNNQFSKASINTLLETNPAPAIWIGNTIRGIDPAYLRRFDFCLKVDLPKGDAAAELASEVLKGVPIRKSLLDQIAENTHITPAALEKARSIYKTMDGHMPDANTIVCQSINSGLEVKGLRGNKLLDPAPHKNHPSSPYSLDYVNTDADIGVLTNSISDNSEARICLYGPPGTGKTAWAEHLAKRLKLKLLVKRASDIMDPYIGVTERNIADMFRQAESENALLLIDEADTFLQKRENAHRQWEISHVNEFLTRMEAFKGLLVCTTNLMESMDAATLRRFDFKIRLNYLDVDQAVNLASHHLSAMNCPLGMIDVRKLRFRIASLEVTPGDFKVLERRYRVMSVAPSPMQFLDDLTRETEFRSSNKKRPIGFAVDIQQRVSE